MVDETHPQTGGMEPAYLGQLSALAAHTFSSTDALMEAILTLVVDQLGMRTSFLTHIVQEQDQNSIIAAHNEPGGCDVLAGTELPLEDTF
jgi:hypothetical protein